jgi:hypothetical protein
MGVYSPLTQQLDPHPTARQKDDSAGSCRQGLVQHNVPVRGGGPDDQAPTGAVAVVRDLALEGRDVGVAAMIVLPLQEAAFSNLRLCHESFSNASRSVAVTGQGHSDNTPKARASSPPYGAPPATRADS